MLVTEDEAKTKRCQESFGDSAVTLAGSTITAPLAPITASGMAQHTSPAICIGSACMAWRWGQNLHRDREKVGYCGKAGKP